MRSKICAWLLPLLVDFTVVTKSVAGELTKDPASWRPVVYTDLQIGGPANQSFLSLWSDAIAKNNRVYLKQGDRRWTLTNAPAVESHFLVRSDQKTVVLSVLNSVTGCKIFQSDSATKSSLKHCPMRLAVYDRVKRQNSVSDAGTGCFIEYGGKVDPSSDPARNASLAAYDIATKTIRTRVIFADKLAKDCEIRVPISN